eukprot:scaffold9676_cov200-Amphora_coffeaeformis.AAC.5
MRLWFVVVAFVFSFLTRHADVSIASSMLSLSLSVGDASSSASDLRKRTTSSLPSLVHGDFHTTMARQGDRNCGGANVGSEDGHASVVIRKQLV